MSISLTKDGINSSSSKITFTDGSNSLYVHANGVLENASFYFVDGFRFDKNKTILIQPIVVRTISTSANGTATLNLLTNALTNSNNISVELGSGSISYLTALQKILSLKNHNYSYKLLYSSVSYDSTLGTTEKNDFKASKNLVSSNYSLANKAPTVETPGSGSVTLTFNSSAKTVGITSNKKSNWSLIGIYVSIL